MIGIDLGLVLLVLLGGIWGLLRGAILQLIDAAVWIASLLIPGFFGGSLAHALEGPLNVPYVLAYAYSLLSLFLLTQISARLAIRAASQWRANRLRRAAPARKDGQPEPAKPSRGVTDSLLGGLLGATKIAFAVWIGLSFVGVVNVALIKRGYQLKLADSGFYTLAVRYNAFWMLFGDAAEKINRALQGGVVPARYRELLKDERFAELARDEGTKTALRLGDFGVLERSPALLALVTDDPMMRKLDGCLAEKQALATKSLGVQALEKPPLDEKRPVVRSLSGR